MNITKHHGDDGKVFFILRFTGSLNKSVSLFIQNLLGHPLDNTYLNEDYFLIGNGDPLQICPQEGAA